MHLNVRTFAAMVMLLQISVCGADIEQSKFHKDIWEFSESSGAQGWNTTEKTAMTLDQDGLKVVMPAGELRLVSPKHAFMPFTTDYICARVKSDQPLNICVAFRSEKFRQWSQDKVSESISVPADGQFHDIQFTMTKNELWQPANGFVLQVAFVVNQVGKNRANVCFKWIRAQNLPLGQWDPQLRAQRPSPDGIVNLKPLPVENKYSTYTCKDTGNEVTVLTNLPGNCYCTYHYNKFFNRGGKWMVFIFQGAGDYAEYTGVYNLELATGRVERLTGSYRGLFVISPDGKKLVYFEPRNSIWNLEVNSLWELGLETKNRRHIWDLPINLGLNDFSVSADSRYAVIQTFTNYQPTKEEQAEIAKMTPRGAAGTNQLLLSRNQPRYWNTRINLQTREAGQIDIIDQGNLHNQCSPTDPDTMMVQYLSALSQPFWLVNIQNGQYHSLLDYEQWHKDYQQFILGHPCWSLDGKTVWCEGREWVDTWSQDAEAIYSNPEFFYIAEKRFHLCKIDVASGLMKTWPVDIDHWSVHYTPTKWDDVLVCDGSELYNYLFIIKILGDKIETTNLCAITHNYYNIIEPMSQLSPDNSGVVFQTIVDGHNRICRVAIPESVMAKVKPR